MITFSFIILLFSFVNLKVMPVEDRFHFAGKWVYEEVTEMAEQKKTEATKESVEANEAQGIKLDDLPKKLTEEEAKNVAGGRFI